MWAKPSSSKVFSPISFCYLQERGLFKTSKQLMINADINGSLQIMRKAVTNSLDEVIEDVQFIHHCCQPRLVTV